MMDDPGDSKRHSRREIAQRIRALPIEERAERSREIGRRLMLDSAFRQARRVFAYLSLPSEPSLEPLVGVITGQTWAFPRVTDEGLLVFHEMAAADLGSSSAGSLGIREPAPTLHPACGIGQADLILVPGVGFDPVSHARLGRGKGHYDRYLQQAVDLETPPQIVGIAFDVQLAPLAAEPHDIPMHRILTDRGWC
ncbi:MAG TPA: 5-formyltetrahydrofolate cyclo-ligase [Bacteroidia bacterium]|nr:5-formyltetrahydrofolate cyclo-ligase [Bacteroidia bacterium]